MEGKFDLRPLLKYIPADDYKTWQKVGAALKYEGYSVNDWEEWSQQSSKFKPGECAKKWQTFTSDGKTATGRSITWLAKRNGWHPEPKQNNIPQNTHHLNSGIKPLDNNPITQLLVFMNVLFNDDEYFAYTTSAKQADNGKFNPIGTGVYQRTAGELKQRLQMALSRNETDLTRSVFKSLNPSAGAWIRLNPMDGKYITDENVTQFRHALVESDAIPVKEQYELYQKLNLPIATLTYSGGKSLHAVVKIDADNRKQYDQRVKFLYQVLEQHGVKPDENDKNPSRLSRMPGVQRGDEQQFLVAANIGAETWSDWCWGIPGEPLSKDAKNVIYSICQDVKRQGNYLSDFEKWINYTTVNPSNSHDKEDFRACELIAYHVNQVTHQWSPQLINEVFLRTRLFDPKHWYKPVYDQQDGWTTYGHRTIKRAIERKQGKHLSRVANKVMGWHDGFTITVKDGSIG